MEHIPIFQPFEFGEKEKALLDKDGHFLLPGILTPRACERLTASLSHIEDLMPSAVKGQEPSSFAAEYDSYLESLILHPQMCDLVRGILGEEIRFDHCVTLNRPGGNGGLHWHSHEYADDDPSLGFLRIFFYVNGFEAGDGGLKAVPGSVVLMWTHAAHAVSPRRASSDMRWTVVYAYRNPGSPTLARWLTPEFEQKQIHGAKRLMNLY